MSLNPNTINICIDIIKIWFRIVICPLILSRSGLGLLSIPPSFSFQTFATITLIHKQIIAMAGYYACGAFIFFVGFLVTLTYKDMKKPTEAISAFNQTITLTLIMLNKLRYHAHL